MMGKEELDAQRTLIAADVATRLKEVYSYVGGVKEMSYQTGIPIRTLHNFTAKSPVKRTEPKIGDLTLIGQAGNVQLDWLVGRSKEFLYSDPETETESARTGIIFEGKSSVEIPRYDVHLSAGGGHWNDDRPSPLDYIPFTREFLQKKLNRKSTTDLFILEASGDSMLPTIAEDDLILVDERMKTRTDGIYAFVLDGLARVKRFRFMTGGKVQIVSDNRELYPPETLSHEEAEQLHIIGRVRWIGHTV